jgi:hypothetical protein
MKGALVNVLHECRVGPQARILSSAAHGNHAGVQQPAKGPQLRVDTTAVFQAVPVDIRPLTLTN